METISPHRLSFRAVRPAEYAEILGFIDAAFGRRPGLGLLRDFPAALSRANLDHIYLGELDSTCVCAASAVVRQWHSSLGPLLTASIDSFSTPSAFRGRGYSAALQQWMLERLTAEGVHWALLWADRPEIYRGRGFLPVGQEQHARLAGVVWPSLPRSHRLRVAELRDAEALLELYQKHPLRCERRLDDMRAYLQPRTSTVLLLENREGIAAYAALEKGQDFLGYVHEYAGEPALVHALWGEAARRGMQHVLVPDGAEAYLEGAAERMMRRRQPAALGRLLQRARLPEGIENLRWAAWGFDSA